ncbi:MAG: PAS domain S-box protein [Bacteroidales bacterium]|nr:PAS domain S-box protein [Bacteroidales bacterium]
MNKDEIYLLASLSSEAVIVTKTDGLILFANDQAISLFKGLSKTGYVSVRAILADESMSQFDKMIEEVAHGQHQPEQTLLLKDVAAEPSPFLVRLTLTTDKQRLIIIIKPVAQKPVFHEVALQDTFYKYSTEAWLFIDMDRTISYFNQAALKFVKLITGKPLEYGKHYSNYLAADQVISIEPAIEDSFKGKDFVVVRNYKFRSSEVFMELSFKAVRKASKIIGVVMTARDITKQKELETSHTRVEEALRKNEMKYKSLIDSAFDAIYITKGRRFEYVNKQFSEITGYSPEEVTSADFDFSITLTERSKEIVNERYKARQRGEEIPSRYSFQLRAKSGRITDVEITTVAFKEGDEVVVMGIMRDISEQLRVEMALENEKAYFRHLVESIPFGIVILDENDHVKSVNPGFTDVFGYSDSEAAGKAINELIVPDEKKTEGLKLTTDVTQGKLVHQETKRKRADGTLVDVSILGKPIITPSGEKLVFGIYQDITEMLLIRKSIDDERAYFQGLFEIVPFGIVLLDQHSEIVDCNTGFTKLFGFTKNEMLGQGTINLIFPEEFKAEGAAYRTQVSQGESVYFETVRKRKNGELLDVAVTARPLKRPDGELFVFAIYQDISDKKKAERALVASENQLSNLISNLPGMVYRCQLDKDYTMTFVSEGSKIVTGFTPLQFVSLSSTVSFNDLILPEYRQSIWNKWLELTESGLPFEEEYEIMDANGQRKWVWERGRGVLDDNGNLQFLEGYIEDITERKLAQKTLDEERYLMQALMDNIPDTIYFKDENSRFIRINYAQVRVMGLKSPDEAIGKTDLDFFNSEHAVKAFEEEQEMMTSGNALVNQQEHIKTSRGWRWFTATKVPLYDNQGKLTGMVGVSRDITELKNMETLLRESEQHLLKTNAEKDKLFSVIAHDLRSPFNSFLMLTEIFADESLQISMEETKQLLSSMHKSASGLVDLLENLLNWSRIQRGLGVVDPKPIVVNELVNHSLDYFDTHIRNKKLDVKVDIDQNLRVLADPSIISSVMRNLISNAVKFTPKGGVINISAYKTEEKLVLLSVADSGIGIPDNMKEKIFNMDIRGRKGTEEEASSGLGLLLVKEFVELSQGKIWFESEEGKGTIFYIKIPENESQHVVNKTD